jgi:glycosyltransferase involved in cell wall biosynthesis
MAKIDVLIPCYKYGHLLPICVKSILEQSVRDVRVLIIDDCSPDDSLAVARSLAAADDRVTVWVNERNLRHIATYNEGIGKWLSSDYFMLLSADDAMAPGAIARAIEIMDANPDITMVHGNCLDWNTRGPFPDAGPSNDKWSRHEGASFIREHCYYGFNMVHTPSVIARTSIQKRVGGYDPRLPHAGDLEMWLRFAAHGAIAYTRGLQAYKGVHDSNMTDLFYAARVPEFQQRLDAFNIFFDAYQDRVADAAALRARAHRSLAEGAYWSGVAQIAHGRFGPGSGLLRFAFGLRPRLRFLPPIGRLVREGQLAKFLSRRFGRNSKRR